MSQDVKQVLKYHVFCCTTTRPPERGKPSCGAKSANDLTNYLWEKTSALELEGARINPSSCLGMCDSGPVVVVYPEGAWYRLETKADVDELVQSHLVEGRRVERLLLNQV